MTYRLSFLFMVVIVGLGIARLSAQPTERIIREDGLIPDGVAEIGTVEQLQAVLPEEKDPAAEIWRSLPEKEFERLLHIARYGGPGENAQLSKGLQARMLRMHMDGILRRLTDTKDAAEQEMLYRRWCDYRLDYLDNILLGRDRYEEAWNRIGEGVAQGLRPEDASREKIHYWLALAQKTQYRDSIREQENRYWLEMYLQQLGRVEDPALRASEEARIQYLLRQPDRDVREKAAMEIKRAWNGNYHWEGVPWDEHEDYMAAAIAEVRKMMQLAADAKARDRVARDAMEVAIKAEQLYAEGFHALLLDALALRDVMVTDAQRAAMDVVYALALVKRGRIAEGAAMAESIKMFAKAVGDARPEELGGQTDRILREIAKQQVKPENIAKANAPARPAAVEEAPRSVEPVLSPEQMRRHYAVLASEHLIQVACETDDIEAARNAIDSAVEACRKALLPRLALTTAERILACLEPDPLPAKQATAERARVYAMMIVGQHEEAIRLGEEMLNAFMGSEDPIVRDECDEMLGLLYLILGYHLQRPMEAEGYLILLKQRDVEGHRAAIIDRIEELVSRRNQLPPPRK